MDIDIRTLLARLNPECKRAMAQAAELCVTHTHYNVELEHLLRVLLEGPAPDVRQVLGRFQVDPSAVTAQVQQGIDRFKRGNGRTPALSPHFAPLFQEAWLLSAMLLGQQQVRSGTVLLALLEVDSLRGLLLEMAPALLEIPRETLRQELAGLLSFSAEDAGGTTAGGGLGPVAVPDGEPVARMPEPQRPHAGAKPALDQFTIDLTAQAREGRVDPIRGRDAEIRQIIDILLRRRQNNPILTGEAGVGKTAVSRASPSGSCKGGCPPPWLA